MMYYRRTIVQTAALSSAILFRYGKAACSSAGSVSHGPSTGTESGPKPTDSGKPYMNAYRGPDKYQPTPGLPNLHSNTVMILEPASVTSEQSVNTDAFEEPSHTNDTIQRLNHASGQTNPKLPEPEQEPTISPRSTTDDQKQSEDDGCTGSDTETYFPYKDVVDEQVEDIMGEIRSKHDRYVEAMAQEGDLPFTENPIYKQLVSLSFDEEEHRIKIGELSDANSLINVYDIKKILKELDEKKLITFPISEKLVVKEDGVLKWHFETVSRALKIYAAHNISGLQYGIHPEGNKIMYEDLEDWSKKVYVLSCHIQESRLVENYWKNLKTDDEKREVYEYIRTGIISGSPRSEPGKSVYSGDTFSKENLRDAREFAYERFYDNTPAHHSRYNYKVFGTSKAKVWWSQHATPKQRWRRLIWEPSCQTVRCFEYEIMVNPTQRKNFGIKLPFEVEPNKCAECCHRCCEQFWSECY